MVRVLVNVLQGPVTSVMTAVSWILSELLSFNISVILNHIKYMFRPVVVSRVEPFPSVSLVLLCDLVDNNEIEPL